MDDSPPATLMEISKASSSAKRDIIPITPRQLTLFT